MDSFWPRCLPVPWARVAQYSRPGRRAAPRSAARRASFVRSLSAAADRHEPDPPGLAPRFFSPSISLTLSLRPDCAARITMTIYGIFMCLANFPNRFHSFGFCGRIFVNRRINPFFAESSAHSEIFWRRSVFFGPRKKKEQLSVNPDHPTSFCISDAIERNAYIVARHRVFAVLWPASACSKNLLHVVLCEY